MSTISQQFLEHLEKDFVCLHPTDTIPGIGFNPLKTKGHQGIIDIKQRNPNKPFIGFVGSLDRALSCWTPLPGKWNKVLEKLWPCSMSVVWKASTNAPSSLVFEDNTIAIRCPKFKEEFSWMQEVLNSIDYPLPSTSVNRTAEYPCVSWDEALNFLQGIPNVFIPNTSINIDNFQSSTLIKILEDGSFSMIREGPVSKTTILEALE